MALKLSTITQIMLETKARTTRAIMVIPKGYKHLLDSILNFAI